MFAYVILILICPIQYSGVFCTPAVAIPPSPIERGRFTLFDDCVSAAIVELAAMVGAAVDVTGQEARIRITPKGQAPSPLERIAAHMKNEDQVH